MFLFADKIKKLPEKNGNMWVPKTSQKTEKNTWAKRILIYPYGSWKDNIRSVIFDWRQRSAGCSNERERSSGRSNKGERSASLSNERRELRVNQANMLCVSSGRLTTSQNVSLPQKKDMCELSLTVFLLHTIVAVEEWKYKLYFYISPSFLCLSSGLIYVTHRSCSRMHTN